MVNVALPYLISKYLLHKYRNKHVVLVSAELRYLLLFFRMNSKGSDKMDYVHSNLINAPLPLLS